MLVHTPSQSLLLRVRNPQVIRNILPAVKDVDYESHNLAVRHGLDEVRVLRNLGIAAPPPILHYYDWPIQSGRQPFKHQKETAAFLTLYPRSFNLDEPGTAKTASSLWAADYLMRIGHVRKVLIAAPLSTLDLVWATEIFGLLMHRRCAVLHGSRERRLELLGRDFDFYIINHHGIITIRRALISRSDIDLVIVDESAEYRNGSTDMYEAIEAVTEKRRVWLLTGTPCPKSPEDAWSQVRLVNKARVPVYKTQWKRQTMLQVATYKWIPKRNSPQLVHDAMQPAIRHKKSECLDLPPVLYEQRSCKLTEQQTKAYNAMRLKAVMEAAEGGKITAVNAADKINKLRQILLGAIKHPVTGAYEVIDHAPRFNLLLECIEHSAAKVIVICPFKGIIQSLHTELVGHYSAEIINGDVTRTQRNDIINRFKNGNDPHVLLCHPRVMAHGLNLSAADMTIFYGPIYSNNDDQQVIERFNRPGQTRKMTIMQLGTMPLEWEIYKQVAGQKVGQESILSLYKNEVLGMT